jgi:hypothetical protein
VNLGTIKGGRCYRTGSVKGTTLDGECQRTYTVDERREHSCEARQLRPRPVPPRVNHSFAHPLLGIAELLDCVPCLPASGRDSSRPLPRNGYASALSHRGSSEEPTGPSRCVGYTSRRWANRANFVRSAFLLWKTKSSAKQVNKYATNWAASDATLSTAAPQVPCGLRTMCEECVILLPPPALNIDVRRDHTYQASGNPITPTSVQGTPQFMPRNRCTSGRINENSQRNCGTQFQTMKSSLSCFSCSARSSKKQAL